MSSVKTWPLRLIVLMLCLILTGGWSSDILIDSFLHRAVSGPFDVFDALHLCYLARLP